MTYKNYALDHFLKALLEYSDIKVLRIGSSADSFEELKRINLNEVMVFVSMIYVIEVYQKRQPLKKIIMYSMQKSKEFERNT